MAKGVYEPHGVQYEGLFTKAKLHALCLLASLLFEGGGCFVKMGLNYFTVYKLSSFFKV